MNIYKIFLKWYGDFCFGYAQYHYDKMKNAKYFLDPSSKIIYHQNKCDKWWDRHAKIKDKLNSNNNYN